MKLGTILLAFAAGVLVLPSAYAKQPRLVDASGFDVAGVKIGMDFEQAREAVAKHFNVAPGEIRSAKYSPPDCGGSDVAWRVKEITGAEHPFHFGYKKDNVELAVCFEPRLPVDKARPVTVVKVVYQIPKTKENAAAMREAALSKYGEPTYTKPSNPISEIEVGWCAKINTTFNDCTNPKKDQAKLFIPSILDGTTMILEDPRPGSAATQYLQELKDSKAKTKPKF